MVGDTRNGEHHEQQQEINDGLLHGLGGRAACNDIRDVRRDRAGDGSFFNSMSNMPIRLKSCELCASHEHAPVFRITDGNKKSSACATRRFPRYSYSLHG